MNGWIHANEALWLFWILVTTGILELYVATILTAEYFYDKSKDEKRSKRVKKTKDKVTIEVKDGQASIVEKPDYVDVNIQHRD